MQSLIKKNVSALDESGGHGGGGGYNEGTNVVFHWPHNIRQCP